MVPYLSGLVFGIGLVVAGMTRPDNVVGFLNVVGDWKPALMFVMVGAIGVHLIAYRVVPAVKKPLFAEKFGIPTRSDIDWKLVAGATLFGSGWALGGYCPGPALVSVVSGATQGFVFVGTMFLGMAAYQAYDTYQAQKLVK